jgi:hypothetical protein
VPNFEEFGFKVGIFFLRLKLFIFQLQSGRGGFKPSKTVVFDHSRKLPFIPNKRGTNLTNKLLEIMHMLRLKLFYLGLPNETGIFERVWPPHVGLSLIGHLYFSDLWQCL